MAAFELSDSLGKTIQSSALAPGSRVQLRTPNQTLSVRVDDDGKLSLNHISNGQPNFSFSTDLQKPTKPKSLSDVELTQCGTKSGCAEGPQVSEPQQVHELPQGISQKSHLECETQSSVAKDLSECGTQSGSTGFNWLEEFESDSESYRLYLGQYQSENRIFAFNENPESAKLFQNMNLYQATLNAVYDDESFTYKEDPNSDRSEFDQSEIFCEVQEIIEESDLTQCSGNSHQQARMDGRTASEELTQRSSKECYQLKRLKPKRQISRKNPSLGVKPTASHLEDTQIGSFSWMEPNIFLAAQQLSRPTNSTADSVDSKITQYSVKTAAVSELTQFQVASDCSTDFSFGESEQCSTDSEFSSDDSFGEINKRLIDLCRHQLGSLAFTTELEDHMQEYIDAVEAAERADADAVMFAATSNESFVNIEELPEATAVQPKCWQDLNQKDQNQPPEDSNDNLADLFVCQQKDLLCRLSTEAPVVKSLVCSYLSVSDLLAGGRVSPAWRVLLDCESVWCQWCARRPSLPFSPLTQFAKEHPWKALAMRHWKIQRNMRYGKYSKWKIMWSFGDFLCLGNDVMVTRDQEDCAVLSVWLLSKEQRVFNLNGQKGYVQCAEMSSDSKLLCTVSDDCSLSVWNLTNGKRIQDKLGGHTLEIDCLAVSDKLAVTGGGDGFVRLWDIEAGLDLRVLDHDAWVSHLQLDKNHILSSDVGGNVRLWTIEKGECVHKWQTQSKEILGLKLDGANGRAVVDTDVGVLLYGVKDGRLLHTIKPNNKETIISMHLHGDILLTQTQSAIEIWDMRTAKLTTSFKPKRYWTDMDMPLYNGLFAAAEPDRVHILDVRTGETVRSFEMNGCLRVKLLPSYLAAIVEKENLSSRLMIIDFNCDNPFY